MTHKEIVQKVKDTYKVGDRVFIHQSTQVKGAWYKISQIDYNDKFIYCYPEKNGDYIPSITFANALAILSFTEYTLQPVGFSQERPKPKKKNGEPFEVGDEVWISMGFGIRAGKVVKTKEDYGGTWEILVEVQEVRVNSKFTFSLEGKYLSSGDIVLFHQKPVIIFED